MLSANIELVAGHRVRVARLGDGPPIVFLHGYPDNLQIWCELVAKLASRFQCITFDWPGTGYSDEWPGGATPMHMAERLHTLLDAWHIDRCAVVGADMGGQPALAFAATFADRVSFLIVMNSLVFGDEATSWEIRILRKFGWNRVILRWLPGLVFRRAERTFLPRGARLPADLRSDLWQSFRSRSVRKFISKMCAGYQGTLPRLPHLYEKVRCPTLILWAERDKHFPLAHARRLQATVAGSQLHIVPAAEHWMAWYQPDDLAAQVLQFADAVQNT